MERVEYEQEQYEQEVVSAARRGLATEAKQNPKQVFLHVDDTGKPDWEVIPKNLHFLTFADLENANLGRQSLDRVHLQLPLGLLHGNLLVGYIVARRERANQALGSVYPAVKVDGRLTIVDYEDNRDYLLPMVKEHGFIPDPKRQQRYPAGPIKDNPLRRYFAIKP